MRIGTETGSLVNAILAEGSKRAPEPEVGMGATVLMWTDRKAATVVKVEGEGWDKVVHAQIDRAVRTDKNGMSDAQTYDYSPDPDGPVHQFKRDRGGQWVEVHMVNGKWSFAAGGGGNRLAVGYRREFYDFGF